jgi:hypothetical protein
VITGMPWEVPVPKNVTFKIIELGPYFQK